MNSPATFGKQERMVSRKLIEELFDGNGSHSMASFPLRVIYKVFADSAAEASPEGQPPVQVLVSVSKRRFRHAVDRNRAKRQVREAYRLNKQALWSSLAPGSRLAAAFVWLADQPVGSHRVHQAMQNLLRRMAEKQAGRDGKSNEHSGKDCR